MNKSERVKRRLRLLVFLVFLGWICIPSANAVISGVSTYEQVVGGDLDGWFKYTLAIFWDTSAGSNKGASHMDIILDGAIDCPDVLAAIAADDGIGAYDPLNDGPYFRFEPDDPLDIFYEGISGTSTSEGDPLNPLLQDCSWYAYLAMSDAGPTPPIEDTVLVKYEQPPHLASDPETEAPNTEPENMGYATFWYYSFFGPGETQTPDTIWEDKLFVKAGDGGGTSEYGDITGYMPDCTVIPEPTTIMLFGLGTLGLLKKKKQ